MKSNCVICNKKLEWFNKETLQPYGGGEIQLHFAYGSIKFDNYMRGTVYKAIICDECAEKLVPKMVDDSMNYFQDNIGN